jgi:2'-5' RNA ligase
MKRTFIAADVQAGEKLKKIISMLREELSRDSIKWVDAEQMHLTLAFLGDTDDEVMEKVSRGLEERCSGFGSISFDIKGLGVFPDVRRPRVIWAGIEEAAMLLNLQSVIVSLLASLSIPAEEREFKPHLTLGRVKFIRNTERLQGLIYEHQGAEFQKVTIKKVIYYESILQPAGPLYKPLSTINL